VFVLEYDIVNDVVWEQMNEFGRANLWRKLLSIHTIRLKEKNSSVVWNSVSLKGASCVEGYN